MRLSGSEQRRWRELEAQLSRDRRLAALSRRLATPRAAGGEVPQRACHVCVLTVCAGLGAGLVLTTIAQGQRQQQGAHHDERPEQDGHADEG